MKNHLLLKVLPFVCLVAIFLLSGCEEDIANCNDNFRTLELSEYCSSPILIEFPDLDQPDTLIDSLPDVCFQNYDFSRTVKINVPTTKDIRIHQFHNFPGQVTTEVFGTNCDGFFVILNEACEASKAVVKVIPIDASGYQKLYVRMVYQAAEGHTNGKRKFDHLAIAAYAGDPDFDIFKRTESSTVYRHCDSDKTNRIILSPGSDTTAVIEMAKASGLTYDSCACANGSLLALYAPVGVDINAVKPRVRSKTGKPDTTGTLFPKFSNDNIISIPPIAPSSDNDQVIPAIITDNACLSIDPGKSFMNGAGGVTIAIVDSGIDPGPNFGYFANNFASVVVNNCIPASQAGADLVEGDQDPDDEIGHGTAVASALLSGFDPYTPVNLLHYKFITQEGGSLFDGLCASHASMEAKADIINLSWGFRDVTIPPALIGMLERAQIDDVIIVASAGNDTLNLDSIAYWPASAGSSYGNMITVAAYELNMDQPVLAKFSNFSPKFVEVAALYTHEALKFNTDQATFYPVGTSISAPIVARKLAMLLKENPTATADEIVQKFLREATRSDPSLGGMIKDNLYLSIPDSDNCVIF